MKKDKISDKGYENKNADIEYERQMNVLKMLARGNKITDIAQQVNRSEKWVRVVRDKSLSSPPSLIKTYPQIVQEYMMKRKPELKYELEKIANNQNITEDKTLAVEISKSKHQDDLVEMAKSLEKIWDNYLESGTEFKGYILPDNSLEPYSIRRGYIANLLLTHMKTAFPEKFGDITHWTDLLKAPLPLGVFDILLLFTARGLLKGTCEVCHEWK
jgi:hypothetical protein